MMREAGSIPTTVSDRIVDFHERQDARYATAAAELSAATGKPILVASELGVADPDNPGPATVRATGQAVLPQRQPGRDRARAPVARRQTPPPPRADRGEPAQRGVVAVRRPRRVVLLPALALFGLWRFAAGRDGETVESLPPTTVAAAGAPPPRRPC